ncbi:uncharacterized protein M421DRAFT_156236 [Didymella exigua CBS 183.55]|uniref:Uncharacterized protein n=1 Tax=Didymella exigua CBS 183.55 TaxID=1150837 RepID=A0A6A5RIM5_9PLEO|nr:uncharacterized protein M421DRAFT_156236 [Didymella exigua CBS 183.55]KAF1928195.1 hypothetical protein M421DRAFT_156236 [Didymella exigua CBS 183.55]
MDTATSLEPVSLFPALGWLCRLRGWPSPCTITTHVGAAHHIQQDTRLLNAVAYSSDICHSCRSLEVSSVLQVETKTVSRGEIDTPGCTTAAVVPKCHLVRPTRVIYTTSYTRTDSMRASTYSCWRGKGSRRCPVGYDLQPMHHHSAAMTVGTLIRLIRSSPVPTLS